MTWYAVRTMPGFQAPHRERWPEPNPRRGYTIVSALDHSRSKIEANLEAKGFTYYMPAEYIAVRNRKKAGSYELRRFAMLKGFIFIDLADTDWLKLYDVPGVRGVVENCGQPFAIGALDLFRLRMYEQNSRAVAVAKVESLSKANNRIERSKREGIVRGARKKLFPGREVKLIWGDEVGREATVKAWSDQDQVMILLKSLEASTETITVPFEYLKVAS